jgi:hypothetical protein
MSANHYVEPKRAAQIEQRIGQAFDFAIDVVEMPEMLEELPDESVLGFHDDVPHPDIPANVYIVTATTPHGESIALAIDACICHGTRDARWGILAACRRAGGVS